MLFAPLAGLEVQGTSVRGSVLVVSIRINCNNTGDGYIEQACTIQKHTTQRTDAETRTGSNRGMMVSLCTMYYVLYST